MIKMSGPYEVQATETGVRCGNHHRDERVKHEDADSVRACYQLTKDMEADEAALNAAEQGYERYLEDRGYWAARAQEEYEARMGIW